jgi:hypothetical protein
MSLEEFLDKSGRPYSEELGIDLKSCRSGEICKWFLAAILFGARISEAIAKNTYGEFEKAGVTTARKIVETGWEGLVAILDAGGYVRYDFKTADKLLDVFGNLHRFYGGDLNKVHKEARDPRDLEERLKSLGRGVGDVTVAIFLRDMRYCWDKADPRPTSLVTLAMEHLGIEDLKRFAKDKGVDLVKLETMLVRLGRDLRKKKRTRIAYDEVRGMEELILDILENIHPEELSLKALSELTGSAKTYLARRVLSLRDEGKVTLRKTEEEVYCRFKGA